MYRKKKEREVNKEASRMEDEEKDRRKEKGKNDWKGAGGKRRKDSVAHSSGAERAGTVGSRAPKWVTVWLKTSH